MKDTTKRERRHFTGQQKTAIVKAHLVDGKSVADLCDEHQIQPTQFYQWQKQLFEQGEAAFERKTKSRGKSSRERKGERKEKERGRSSSISLNVQLRQNTEYIGR